MMKTSFKRSTVVLALLAPFAAFAQIGISVNIAPPPLPYYAQPPIPGDGYIWTPGYWNWNPGVGDYAWVPGTWVLPPTVGFLWTPGYWGFVGGAYLWHGGYWGNHVGYYGGLNYGYGYGGHGYIGGNWDHGHFRYNQAVNNIPQGRVHNFYNRPMAGRGMVGRDSFNGAGSHFRGAPTVSERRYEAGQHGGPTAEQSQHESRAMGMPEQRMANNHGMPPTAATGHPGGFGEPEAERGRSEAEMRTAPAMHGPAGGGGHPEGGHPGGGGGERPGGGGGGGGHGEHR